MLKYVSTILCVHFFIQTRQTCEDAYGRTDRPMSHAYTHTEKYTRIHNSHGDRNTIRQPHRHTNTLLQNDTHTDTHIAGCEHVTWNTFLLGVCRRVQSTSSCCCGWTFPDQLQPMTSRDPCNIPCVGAPEPFCVGQEGVTHYVTVYFTQGKNLSHRSEKNQSKTRDDRPADTQKTTDVVLNQTLEPVGLSYPDHVAQKCLSKMCMTFVRVCPFLYSCIKIELSYMLQIIYLM